MGQTRASQFCGLFIPCNRSLLLSRLPDSCRDKGTGRGFQRLNGLGQRPSQGQLIPIIFLSQGVGAGTGGAGSPVAARAAGVVLLNPGRVGALY